MPDFCSWFGQGWAHCGRKLKGYCLDFGSSFLDAIYVVKFLKYAPSFCLSHQTEKYPWLSNLYACTYLGIRSPVHWHSTKQIHLSVRCWGIFCHTSKYSKSCHHFYTAHSFSLYTLWQLTPTVCFNNKHKLIMNSYAVKKKRSAVAGRYFFIRAVFVFLVVSV